MDQIINRIDEILYAKCSVQENDILLYFKQNLDKLPQITLSMVADNTFCSTTSVTRLVKKLGFNNYRELQYLIKLSQNQNYNLLNTSKHNDYNAFIKCFKSVDCVYIYGKGASQVSALYLFRKLLKANLNASLINEQDLLYSLVNRTIIVISNSGQTSSVLDIIRDIKEINHCQILTITKSNSPLDQIADASINTPLTSDRDNQSYLITEIENLIKHINIL